MRVPGVSAGIGKLIELLWFTICAILADSDVAGLEKQLLDIDALIRKVVLDRNVASDALTKVRAVRAVALRRYLQWQKQLHLDAVAAFGGKKKSLAFVRIFPMPPSGWAALSAADRLTAADKLQKALASPETPKALAAAAAEGKKRLDALIAAEKSVADAQAVVNGCTHNIAVAREKWFAAYKGIHGTLVAKFPNDKDQVESYFDSPSPPAKPKEMPTQA